MKKIKHLFKNLLFGRPDPKTFPAVRIPEGEIREKVFLKEGNFEEEISSRHCVVCHRPFLVAVWNVSPEIIDGQASELLIKTGNEIQARTQLVYSEKIQIEEKWLTLFFAQSAKNYQLGYLRQLILHRYFKNKDKLFESKIYAALYSYPRQVIIVSFREGDYYNIFPMDFHCAIQSASLALFGLRTTNFTIEKIIRSKKLVISDSSSLSLETIYQLGRNHSQSPPLLQDLPFKTIESELHRFPIPENSSVYSEIEIVDYKNLGSHRLMIGKIVHQVKLKEKKMPVHHIQFFQSFKSDYAPA